LFHGFAAAARTPAPPASRLRDQKTEKVYDLNWWSKVVEGGALPFRPLEPGAPDIDPATGNVYVATGDGKVHALKKSGAYQWEYDAGGPFNAGPLFVDERVFVGTSEGRLVCLHAYSGEKVWEYATSDELLTRPVVSDGLALVVSAGGTVFAVDAKSGQWKWQYRRDFTGDFSIRGAARPLLLDGRVYAGFADGFAVALDAKDGGVLWARPLGSGAQFLDVDADPIADELGRRVYFASYSTGVFALDAETGSTAWSVTAPGMTTLLLEGGSGRLYAGGQGKVLALDSERGFQIWQLTIGNRAVSGMALLNRMLLLATGQGPLLFVDALDARPRQVFDPGRGVAARPTIGPSREALILSNRGHVYSLSMVARGRR
jgi:outer membrane protein assembly factor BamB